MSKMAPRKSGGRWCAARYCSSNCVQRKDLSFFAFPKDEERSKKWVVNCKRQDLITKEADYLNKNCFLCSKHFEHSQFYNFLKNRLKSEAIPTIFELSKPQKDLKRKNPSHESNPKQSKRVCNDVEQSSDNVEVSLKDNLQINEDVPQNICATTECDTTSKHLISCSIDSLVEQTQDCSSDSPFDLETIATNSGNVTSCSNSIQLSDDENVNLDFKSFTSSESIQKSTNEIREETSNVSPSSLILRQCAVVLKNNVDNCSPSNKISSSKSLLKSRPLSSHVEANCSANKSTSASVNSSKSTVNTARVLKVNNNDNKEAPKPASIELANAVNIVNKDHNYLSLSASSSKRATTKLILKSTAPAPVLGTDGRVGKPSSGSSKPSKIIPLSVLKIDGKSLNFPTIITSPNNSILSKSSNSLQTLLLPISNLQLGTTILPTVVRTPGITVSPVPTVVSEPTTASEPATDNNKSLYSDWKYQIKYQNAKKLIRSLRVKCSRLTKKIEERQISTQQFKLFCDEFLPKDVANFIKTKVKIKRRPLKPCEQNTSDVELKEPSDHLVESESNKIESNVHNENVELESVIGEVESNKDELNLKDRSKNKTAGKYYSCDLCVFVTDKKLFLNRHKYNEHSTDRPFNCDQCDYRAKTKKMLRYHLEVHGNQTYPCVFCTKSYRLKSTYNKHLIRVHKQNKKNNSCHLCSFQTRFLTSLKRHLLEEHQIQSEDISNIGSEDATKQLTKQCPYCECQLKNNAVFEDHLAVKHQVDKDGNPAQNKFKCKHCEFTCVARFQLSNHYHLKHGRKWICEFCEFTCDQKGKLDSHIKFRHLGIKAFVCETCGFQLASLSSLKQHMLLRHKPKENHVCSLCFKSFTRRLYLQKHIRLMHSDIETRHNCPYCAFSARLKGNLNQHITRKHKSEPITYSMS